MARKPKPKPARDRVGEMEDEIKQRDRRIEELREEIDEQRDLIQRQQEQIDDYDTLIEQWKIAFAMEQNADGEWTWAPFMDDTFALRERYDKLLRNWNRFVDEYNAVVVPHRRSVGRPLAASEEDQDRVLKLRKKGKSLRDIAEEAEVGLSTVRTIIDKANGSDRVTRQRWQKAHPGEVWKERTYEPIGRIDPDRAAALRWKAQTRAINAIPKTISRLRKTSDELCKEAKGLK